MEAFPDERRLLANAIRGKLVPQDPTDELPARGVRGEGGPQAAGGFGRWARPIVDRPKCGVDD